MRQAAIRTGPEINKNHGNWRPTKDIRETLTDKFPTLEFPYLDLDHTHGVNSSVHCYCPEHEVFTRISLSGALYRETKFACSICANNSGMDVRKANGFDTRQYIGKRGVQSGIFKAVKAVFPDAIWEYRMKCGKEIDIWVPSAHVGIEYNGNYYHSTACKSDQRYHALKSLKGQKEQKGIFHVFTEEAVAPYLSLVRLIQMAAGGHNYERNSRDEVRVCDATAALAFHREWGFIFPLIAENMCDLHVGLFRRGNLVAVISGTTASGAVVRTSFRLYGAYLSELLHEFERIAARKCSVWADYRNPLEVTAWSQCTSVVRYTGPVKIPLDKSFNVIFEANAVGASSIFDCGSIVFSR